MDENEKKENIEILGAEEKEDENTPVSYTVPVSDTNKKKKFFHKITKEDIKATFKKPKRLITITVIVVLCCLLVGETIFCVMLKSDYTNSYNSLIKSIASANSSKTQTEDAVKIVEEISKLYQSSYVGDIDEEQMTANLIYAYLVSTGDKYTYYYTPEEWEETKNEYNGNSSGIGAIVTKDNGNIVIGKVFDDSPADKAGLKQYDIIVSADGEDLSQYTLNDAVARIKGESGTTVTLGIVRDNKNISIDVTRGDYTYTTVSYEVKKNDAGDKIGYIKITNFYTETPNEFKEAVEALIKEDVTGFVFDVRDNPGGELTSVLKILDYLLPEGPVVRLTFKDSTATQTYSSDGDYATDLPFVVLANGNTASAAELFTSCLMDYDRATFVGVQTYGKGCGQNEITLSNGGVLKITTFYYMPPYSDNYDGVGITPDVEVKLSDDAASKSLYLISEKDDTQLAKALSLIK